MAYQKCVGIGIQVLAWRPDVDDLVLAARDDEAFGEGRRWRYDGERVDEFFAMRLDSTIPYGWTGRLLCPSSYCKVSRGRYDRRRGWKCYTTDLKYLLAPFIRTYQNQTHIVLMAA